MTRLTAIYAAVFAAVVLLLGVWMFSGGSHEPQALNVTTVEKPAIPAPVVETGVGAPRRYNVSAYRGPAGYVYQRWSVGQILPPAYMTQTYILDQFMGYDLAAPQYGNAWVRYGPDALLVNQKTGEILEVRYAMFYS